MNQLFTKIKEYLLQLHCSIEYEHEEDGVFIIQNEAMGISKMVLCCADPILILEEFICDIGQESVEVYKMLLQKNRDIIHGALVLDHTGKRLIFRETLQIHSLDLNELEASFNSLGLLLSEFSEQIISISKQR